MKTPEEYAREMSRDFRNDGKSPTESWETTIPKHITQIIADARMEAKSELLALAIRDCPNQNDLEQLQLDVKRRDDADTWLAPIHTTRLRSLLSIIDWAFTRIAFLANETGYAEDIKAAESRGYERCKQEVADQAREYGREMRTRWANPSVFDDEL